MHKYISQVAISLLFTSSIFFVGGYGDSAKAYHGLSTEIWGYVHTTSSYSNVTVYACSSSAPLPSDCSSSKFFLQAATEGAQWYLGNAQTGWYYRFWAEATDGTKSNYANVTHTGTSTFAGDLTISTSSGDTTPPSSPTGLSATASSPSQINLTWTASTDNVGVTTYVIYRNGSLWYQVTGTSYSDTGLSSNTTYNYYVIAKDAAGNQSGSSVTVSAATQSGTVSCTSMPVTFSGGKTTYVIGETLSYTYTCSPGGTTSYSRMQVIKPDASVTTYVTSSGTHSTYSGGFGTANLLPGNHTLRVCFDSDCTSIAGSAVFYMTNSSSVPPVPSNLTASLASYSTPTATVAALRWTGNTNNITEFHIFSRQQGASWSTSYDRRGLESIGTATSDTTLGSDLGLVGGASGTYEFKVQACNSAGCSSDSNTASLNVSGTATGSDTTPPSTPSGLYTTSVTSSQVGFSWSPSTDAVGVVGYKIYRNSAYVTSVTSTSYTDTNVYQNTSYPYNIAAYDAAGNISNWSSTLIVTTISTTTSTDYTPPSVPLGLRVASVSSSQISFSWSPSTDNVAVREYKIHRNNSYLASATGASYTDTSVAPNTAYQYTVAAYDTNGNYSGWSAPLSVTTPPSTLATDYSPPTAPSGLSVTSVTSSSVTLSWSPSTDAVGVVGYKIYRDGSFQNSVSLTSYSDFGLFPGYTYRYNVAAYDAVGNISPWSVHLNVTTQLSSTGTTTQATSTPQQDTTPPTVGDLSYILESDGRIRVNARFSEVVDQLTLTDSAVFIIGANGSKVAGTVAKYYDAVAYVTSASAAAGAEYQLVIKKDIKDLAGNRMASDYYSPKVIPRPIEDSTIPVDETLANGTVNGSVLDEAGRTVPGSHVHIYTNDFSRSYDFTADLSGFFRAVLPAGTYIVEVYPPLDRRELITPAPRSFTLTREGIQTLELRFRKAVYTIAGTVSFADGRIVSDAEVGAYSPETKQWTRTFTDDHGTYLLNVGSGRWHVAIRPRDSAVAEWEWTDTYREVSIGSETDVLTVNFIVVSKDSILVIRTVDEKGSALEGIGISVDTVSSSNESSTEDRIPPEFQKSDGEGRAIFRVRRGVYYIRGHINPKEGYANPPERAVEITSAVTRDVTLVFKKIERTPRTTVRGRVTFNAGAAASAFVWAWSEQGGYREARSSFDGSFTMSLAADERWHIGASKMSEERGHKSSEIIVDAKEGAEITIDLALTEYRKTPLSSPVTVTRLATQQAIAETTDGARMNMPARAAGSSGTINVEIAPTVEAPSQASAHVVGTVYDVSIKTAAGTAITSLAEEAEITLPYDEDELRLQSLTEDSLVPSFFDESTATWVKLDNYTVDKERNIVIGRVKHLTRFALVAAVDITPPKAPASVNVSALGGGVVVINWTNPPSDFAYAKVYRSEKIGTLGTTLAANIEGRTYSDAAVKDGAWYYYTVRSVDPSGNESTNISQSAMQAVGTSQPKKASPSAASISVALARDLSVGSSGNDVKTLQELLLKEGVYPSGLVTGFFGELTRSAVIRFQEKYATEILSPAGLSKGTGYVGGRTRAKANTLAGKPSSLPPGQAIKAALLATLSLGSKSADVKTLQELLLKEGVYPSGLVTGFFGELTRSAVIRFQEKYAAEILTPAGLTRGTGVVGSSTRKKVNELLK